MISLTLAQLTHVLDGELHLAPGATAEDLVSGGVDTDSRLIEPGGIFVAKPGEVTDGHLFVDAAVAKGAVVAIVEHVVAAEVTQVVVADAIAALADLARSMSSRRSAVPATSASSGSPDPTARPRPRICSPAFWRTRARPSRRAPRSTTRSARP